MSVIAAARIHSERCFDMTDLTDIVGLDFECDEFDERAWIGDMYECPILKGDGRALCLNEETGEISCDECGLLLAMESDFLGFWR
jgi:hypothetical protein